MLLDKDFIYINKSKTKKYQYLYLQQKIETKIEQDNYFWEMYDCWDEI